ncbi:hypothetical protein Cs7R123_41320 [Catellatospora sp. TT07R-123]|uniref:hypothetical protein n=1 Tax=Catellatospora sp. TT07R-123 TaxID=2733863 RepID=UPI001B2D35DF|nr:hypothetical protein [Catellatospora sp. TT07R-123]GHJ46790.1 hypothetical protein Cs7R123_41320 [Catellatospora sp. TT07R-123]
MTGGPPHAYRVTKYDPADRDEHGHYQGPLDITSDHGPVEAAYLAAVAAFARDSGVDRLAVREPALAPNTPDRDPALADLFPDGVHDGAEVAIPAAQQLVQHMLRDSGGFWGRIWCRLEHGDLLTVHIGWDQYMYIASHRPCEQAVADTRRLGLHPEPIPHSPYRHDPADEDGTRRPADDTFWADLADLAVRHDRVLLEEGYAGNTARWHRVTAAGLPGLRPRLAPRARLTVWPDLRDDTAAVAADLPDGLHEVVWQDADGTVSGRLCTEDDHDQTRATLAAATAAAVLSGYADDRVPLLAAIMTDPDGVLRARWSV